MKILQIATAALIVAIGAFTACQNDSSATQGSTGDNATENPAILPGNLQEGQGMTSQDGKNPTIVTVPPADQAALAEPAQNAAGVWHYTCSKGCAGGAGSAIACAKCGTALTHNTGYHPKVDGAKAANTSTQATPPPPPTQKPEPAQNASGVWHYTCSGGCAGGAGATGPCAKCGKALEHNTTYHN